MTYMRIDKQENDQISIFEYQFYSGFLNKIFQRDFYREHYRKHES